MSTTNSKPEINYHWPTPILTAQLTEHTTINAQLLTLFAQHREKFDSKNNNNYVSADTLYETYKDNEVFMVLIRFILDNVFHMAATVNRKYWKDQKIDVNLTGVWFQVTNDYGFHETHIHGNCSWSGVYYVDAGDAATRTKLANGMPNGITRFYGPHLEAGGGGHAELGNIYLQDSSWDAQPQNGRLVVFPSHLKHMAFPYAGEKDRVIVSFHAQVDGPEDLRFNYSLS